MNAEALLKARQVKEFQNYDKSDDHETNVEAALSFISYQLFIDGSKVSDHEIYQKCGISDTCGKK